MYFLEKLAGRLGNCDEHVSDELRKERCPGSRKREHLQATYYRSGVSVTPRILHVNRMIISRTCLEDRGVRIGQCATRCAEDFANAQEFVSDMLSCFRTRYALLQTCRAGRSGRRSDQGEDQSPRRNNEEFRAKNKLPVRAMEAWQFATFQGLLI
jgi:hypothetical protein